MRTFFNIYRNILLVIAVFLAMVMILPLAFQVKPYIVLSPSMEPTIHTGDVCYIQKYEENEKPEIGSIVAFTLNDNETMFVHRVVDVKDGYYITQGDANDTVDLYQPAEEAIVGRAVFIIPYLGTVVSWAKSSQGLIVMAVAVLISILSSFLDTDERKVKKDKKKNVGKIEEPSLFDEKYNEVKTEKSANARTLSDIIKERQKIRNDMMVREKEEWIDDIFATDFEEIKSQEEQLAENVDVAEENADNNEDYVDTKEACDEVETEHVENNESTENEEELVFDFDNMSVEEETRKIFEKHSATISESLDEVSATSYQSVSKIGLNTIMDDIDAKEDDEETFDVTKYAEKYLGNEASEITADTLLFEDDVNDWLFMSDDENSVVMMRYRENIMKSVRKKLESGIYNSSDNFSPSAIYKRAQEALEDDLTDEENDIMNILTVDDINIDIENETAETPNFNGLTDTDENIESNQELENINISNIEANESIETAEYDFETFVESITDDTFRGQRVSELKKIKSFDELKIYTKNSIETGKDKYQGLLVEICFEKAESLDATQNPAQILNYMTTDELYKIKSSLLSEKSKNAIDEIINGRIINNETKKEEKPE